MQTYYNLGPFIVMTMENDAMLSMVCNSIFNFVNAALERCHNVDLSGCSCEDCFYMCNLTVLVSHFAVCILYLLYPGVMNEIDSEVVIG